MIFINEHEAVLDQDEGLLPWAGYDQVVGLAMGFIQRCPVEPRSGLPWYLAYSCFWTDPLRPVDWPDNPAGKVGMAVETLIRYYAYSGEAWFVDVVRSMLDRLIAYHTPAAFAWPGVPYASAEPVFGVYRGARADGAFVTEPDKVAQAALGYLRFYQLTGETSYLVHARHCAQVLAERAEPGDADHSPWPFRVDVRDGKTVEAYGSHVVAAIRLFDELVRMQQDDSGDFRRARQLTWRWLTRYPLRSNCWKGYFEDIRLDPENSNRDQYSALETARYLLRHPDCDPEWKEHAAALIEWARLRLGSEPFFKAVAIHEQEFCRHVMGSHTARYASVCALYAECTGEADHAERAWRSFNWATYMADERGWVREGIDRPDYYNQCWFTDGYFDYVPHFIDGMASLPSLAPSSRDCLLRSSSVVREITYSPRSIRYRTFDPDSSAVLRLTFAPLEVRAGGRRLPELSAKVEGPGWRYDAALGVLRIVHDHPDVEVGGR